MGLHVSKAAQKKYIEHEYLYECLLRDDDVFFDTVRMHIEDAFTQSKVARKDNHPVNEAVFKRIDFRSYLLSHMDALSTRCLYDIAKLITSHSLNIVKTRKNIKKVIKLSISDFLGQEDANDVGHIETLTQLYHVLNDHQNVRTSYTCPAPKRSSCLDSVLKVLNGLEFLPTETLRAMYRKLKGTPAAIPKLQHKKKSITRGFLLHYIKQRVEMISQPEGGLELHPPLAKALYVANLSMGLSSSSLEDYVHYSPAVKKLQNDIANALLALEKREVRISKLRKVQILLDPNSDISNRSLRTSVKKLLQYYLYECDDLRSIPSSLYEALVIINDNSISTLRKSLLKEEKEKVTESILNLSACAKQVLLDILPNHPFDEDFADAYIEELVESEDEFQQSDDQVDHNINLIHPEESCGDNSPNSTGSPSSESSCRDKLCKSTMNYSIPNVESPSAYVHLKDKKLTPDMPSSCNNSYLAIQEVCDGMSIIACDLISSMVDKIVFGHDLDPHRNSQLNDDGILGSMKNGSILINTVEEMVTSFPISGIKKLKVLMDH